MPGTGDLTLSLHGQKSTGSVAPAPQPVLVLALECDRLAAGASRHALGGVVQVLLGRGRERESERHTGAAGDELLIRVPDRWMSSQHARIECSFGRWILYDAGSKNGTLVNGAAVDRVVLRDGDLIELGHTLLWFRERVPLAPGDPVDLHLSLDALRARPPGLLTLAPGYARALGELERVSRSLLPIILTGESGTGKELLARAIHALSGRPGELVAVNCGAVPDSLIESELFGHKRGAFSGANEDRPGLVRSADHGTLFLDEIGDLPLASQAALLRVLQEREVMPVGANRPVGVDIRVIAATHRDLGAMVDRDEFRQDLYARLAGYIVLLPPLRQRREDIGLLIAALMARHAAATGIAVPAIDAAAARALFLYAWPRNVRELDSCLMASAILAGTEPIQLEHLPGEVRQGAARAALGPDLPPGAGDGHATPLPIPGRQGPSGGTAPGIPIAARDDDADDDDPIDHVQRGPLTDEDRRLRDEVVASLRSHAGNISAVARAMGKDRKQIQRWVKRFDLDPQSYR
ncbi:MAG TPA: sigma 54-interacting transcriptional regulator [Kofleriaceae bacterium]|nr:sigma 54-interacting transcriptional regulator [Kofleriaceae bacterium]